MPKSRRADGPGRWVTGRFTPHRRQAHRARGARGRRVGGHFGLCRLRLRARAGVLACMSHCGGPPGGWVPAVGAQAGLGVRAGGSAARREGRGRRVSGRFWAVQFAACVCVPAGLDEPRRWATGWLGACGWRHMRAWGCGPEGSRRADRAGAAGDRSARAVVVAGLGGPVRHLGRRAGGAGRGRRAGREEARAPVGCTGSAAADRVPPCRARRCRAEMVLGWCVSRSCAPSVVRPWPIRCPSCSADAGPGASAPRPRRRTRRRRSPARPPCPAGRPRSRPPRDRAAGR